MTDEQIIKALAHHQAHGLVGAARARVFVEGRWLPRPDWDSLCRALLVVAREIGLPARHKRKYTQEDCEAVLAALRRYTGQEPDNHYHAVGPASVWRPDDPPTG